MTEPKKEFKPQLRLIVQASVPVPSAEYGEAEYDSLKIYLLAISPDVTLNGQIIKMLEPCCKDRKESESKPNENSRS